MGDSLQPSICSKAVTACFHEPLSTASHLVNDPLYHTHGLSGPQPTTGGRQDHWHHLQFQIQKPLSPRSHYKSVPWDRSQTRGLGSSHASFISLQQCCSLQTSIRDHSTFQNYLQSLFLVGHESAVFSLGLCFLLLERKFKVLVAQSCLSLCNPTDCSPPGSCVHGDSPGKNTGVGCHLLLQGLFPTQGLNPGLLLSEPPGEPCFCCEVSIKHNWFLPAWGSWLARLLQSPEFWFLRELWTHSREGGRAGQLVLRSLGLCLPDEDDDGRRLSHGPDHATDTHHTQEGEEGLLTPGTGAFSRNHGRVLRRDGHEACTASEILKGKQSALLTGAISPLQI